MGFSFVIAAVARVILETIPGLAPSLETTIYCSKVLEACYRTQLLSFYPFLSLDAIGAVCHQFRLLGTDLHLILKTGLDETFY